MILQESLSFLWIVMELVLPLEETFETFKTCFEHIQQYVHDQSYAITIKQSKYVYADGQKQLQIVYLHCCKSITYQN
jgi:hypothetical protein